MRLVVLLVLVIALSGRGDVAAELEIDLGGIFGFLKDAIKLVNNVIDISNAGGSMNSEELLRHFAPMDDSIQGLSQGVTSITELLKDMESEGKRVEWDLTVENFESLLRDVTSAYDRFLFYQRNASAIERFTLQQFAETVVSHESNSPQSAMYNLRDVVLGPTLLAGQQKSATRATSGAQSRQKRYSSKQGLFRQLKSLMESSRASVCGLGKSPQQMAFDLYGTLAAVLAKTYSMTQFSYMLLRLFGKGTFKAESEFFRQNYRNISVAVALEADAVMGQLSPAFWRCDPTQHERGATYEEVTELLQGHIENEVDLSADGSCAGECSDFRPARARRCYDSSSDRLCKHQRPCKGTLYGCRFVASSATVCLANQTLGTHRRYNWIQYCDGHRKGPKDDSSLGSCDGTPSASSWLRGFVYCSSCFCLCDDDTHSERYFSLLPAVSDVSENRIVTGARFVKLDDVFYIQLEQGEPGRLGHVNDSTIQWKPIGRRVNITEDVEGRDYVRLSYRNRSVLLQELRGARNRVLTGAAFHFVDGHLSLKIQVTPISDVAAGISLRSAWLTAHRPDPAPAPLRLPSGPVPPTQSAARNWPDSRPGQTVSFEASSFHRDAAQTTLPLLDVQPVAPRPAVWLAGLRLYHKGQKDGGGFLGLSALMANMTLTEGDQKALLRASRSAGPSVAATALGEMVDYGVHPAGLA